MTPAEEIREAARLMRERAEAATGAPWHSVSGTWEGETFAAVIGSDGDAEKPDTWLMATGRGGKSQEADAIHAATWHPGVALAVADWLDGQAGDAADAVPRTGGGWSYRWCDSPAGIESALKIARAYLGEPGRG